jgi:hypothetical protein
MFVVRGTGACARRYVAPPTTEDIVKVRTASIAGSVIGLVMVGGFASASTWMPAPAVAPVVVATVAPVTAPAAVPTVAPTKVPVVAPVPAVKAAVVVVKAAPAPVKAKAVAPVVRARPRVASRKVAAAVVAPKEATVTEPVPDPVQSDTPDPMHPVPAGPGMYQDGTPVKRDAIGSVIPMRPRPPAANPTNPGVPAPLLDGRGQPIPAK